VAGPAPDPVTPADPAPAVSPDRRRLLRTALWIVLSVLLVALVVAGAVYVAVLLTPAAG
jgi:flagellar basal body-associated protein FliL